MVIFDLSAVMACDLDCRLLSGRMATAVITPDADNVNTPWRKEPPNCWRDGETFIG